MLLYAISELIKSLVLVKLFRSQPVVETAAVVAPTDS